VHDFMLNSILNSRAKRLEWSPVEVVSRIIGERKNVINLAGGSPDPRLIPIREIKEAVNEAIEEYGTSTVGYPGAGGLKELRKEVRIFLNKMGIKVNGKEIIITAGAQHAMNIIANILLSEQDFFLAENPTFVETFQALKFYTPNYKAVTLDDQGLVVDDVAKILKSTPKPKIVYTIPTAHNPTGISLSEDRRRYLIELCSTHNVLVIEDDPYRFIIGKPPTALINYDKNNIVLYVGSFSKIIAPGLRVGYVLAPRYLSEKLEQIEQLDFATSTLSMYIVLKLLRKNVIEKRLPMLIKAYQDKMKILLNALEEFMPPYVDWTKPIGGFFVLLKAKGRNLAKLLDRAIREGVAYVPAHLFYIENPDYSTARLSIGPVREEDITEGVRRLAKVLL